MKLNLSQPLTYEQNTQSFLSLIENLSTDPIGADKIIIFNYEIKDEEIILTKINSGTKTPYSEEEKKEIEKGNKPPKRDNENLAVSQGSYSFFQLPLSETEKELSINIFKTCTKFSGIVYVRLFKEKAFETVMQILYPENN